jgi:hypothetical protein
MGQYTLVLVIQELLSFLLNLSKHIFKEHDNQMDFYIFRLALL